MAAQNPALVKEGALPEPAYRDDLALPIDQQKKKDQEVRSAIFRYHEQPGGTLKFAYRRYKDEKTTDYELTDGQKYQLPYGVIRHVNEDCAYPEHNYIMDVNGNPIVSKRKGYQRMELIPTW